MMARLRGMSMLLTVAATTALLTTGAGTASAGPQDIGSCPQGTVSSYTGTGGRVDYRVCISGGMHNSVLGTITDTTDNILCTAARITFMDSYDYGPACGKGNQVTFDTWWMMGPEPTVSVAEIYVPSPE